MNYAVLGPNKKVLRVRDTEPPAKASFVEVTDVQAQQIADGKAATPKVHYYYSGDALLTADLWFAMQAKISELEAARYEAEIVGTTVPALGDVFVRTDKETQSELGKALALLTVDPAFEIDWKFPDGSIVHLDKAAIETVAKKVFTHVQRTRTDYKTKAEAVAAATNLEDIKAVAWKPRASHEVKPG